MSREFLPLREIETDRERGSKKIDGLFLPGEKNTLATINTLFLWDLVQFTRTRREKVHFSLITETLLISETPDKNRDKIAFLLS